MATRSTISILNADATVTKIYCHWDGYPSHNGALLQAHYNTPELIQALQAKGDMSSLGDTPGTSEYYVDRGDTGIEPKVYSSFEDYIANCQFEEYNYLFEDGDWFVSQDETNRFQRLSELVN